MNRQRGYVQLIILGLVAAVIAGGGWYINNLRSSLETERTNRAVAEAALESEKETNDRLRGEVERMNTIQAELHKQIATHAKAVEELRKTFEKNSAGKPRDFGNLVNKKPGLIEKIINKGTDASIRCNELATGAQLTPDEKSGKVQNNQCPALLEERRK